jgi:hypothetical protein
LLTFLATAEDDEESTGKKRKEKAPLEEAEFLKKAKSIKVTINGQEFTLNPKKFTTGSYGWGLAGNVLKVDVDGVEVNAQVTLNLPVRGSKPNE